MVPIEEHSFEGIASGYREDFREFLPTVDGDLLAEVCFPGFPRKFSVDFTLRRLENA